MGWRLALPPSLGRDSVRAIAREFASLLFEAGFETVAPAESYAALKDRLLAGEADAAWGPPLICAQLEAAGGHVVLRSLRWNANSYRSVLVCRDDDRMTLGTLGNSRRRPRAVWVDPHSMAGYLLPRAHLRRLGIEPEQCFLAEDLASSYDACVHRVLDGDADITATFASAEQPRPGVDGYLELSGTRCLELRALGYTAECPNDGVVLSPRLAPPVAYAMTLTFRQLVADKERARLLATAFGVDGFDEPPADTYKPLLGLV